MSAALTTVKLFPVAGGIGVSSPYDREFVSQLKFSIPINKRRWDRVRKIWIIDPAWQDVVIQLAAELFDDALAPVPDSALADKTQTRMLRLLYVGQCKRRDPSDKEGIALGSTGPGLWDVAFPESVLRDWFGEDIGLDDETAPPSPQEVEPIRLVIRPSTLVSEGHYAVLGLEQGASPDEIKLAYRRSVKNWHPDVCRLERAREEFDILRAAYDVLNNEKTRKKYEAGLRLKALQAEREKEKTDPDAVYRRRYGGSTIYSNPQPAPKTPNPQQVAAQRAQFQAFVRTGGRGFPGQASGRFVTPPTTPPTGGARPTPGRVPNDPTQSLKRQTTVTHQNGSDTITLQGGDDIMYRPPVRCGELQVDGVEKLGRFVVSKIIAWRDIHDDKGRTMVATWPPGAKDYATNWV